MRQGLYALRGAPARAGNDGGWIRSLYLRTAIRSTDRAGKALLVPRAGAVYGESALQRHLRRTYQRDRRREGPGQIPAAPARPRRLRQRPRDRRRREDGQEGRQGGDALASQQWRAVGNTDLQLEWSQGE